MDGMNITVDAGDIVCLGIRSVVWKKDNTVHKVADIYSSIFGTAEVYLPQGTDRLSALQVTTMTDKAGHKRLTLKGI